MANREIWFYYSNNLLSLIIAIYSTSEEKDYDLQVVQMTSSVTSIVTDLKINMHDDAQMARFNKVYCNI